MKLIEGLCTIWDYYQFEHYLVYILLYSLCIEPSLLRNSCCPLCHTEPEFFCEPWLFATPYCLAACWGPAISELRLLKPGLDANG